MKIINKYMGDTLRLTLQKHADGTFSAYIRRSAEYYTEDNQGKLYDTLKAKFECNKIRKRKNQLIVFTDSKKSNK